MTNNALIYQRPSKWPIAIAVTPTVLIHLSAVAIAFHQESPAILPAATGSYDHRSLFRRSADFQPISLNPQDTHTKRAAAILPGAGVAVITPNFG
jgi:hypothetical protein